MTVANIIELIDLPFVLFLTLVFVWMEKRRKNYTLGKAIKRSVFVFIVFALFKLFVELVLMQFGL